jgi:heterodisulfide reductase subunit D
MKGADFSAFSPAELLSLEACTRCGRCVPVCPVAVATGEEQSTALAKIEQLRRAWQRQHSLIGRLVNPRRPPDYAGMERAAFECTLCGLCQEICPLGIETRALWLAQRKLLHRAGLTPLPILAMVQAIERTGNVAGRPQEERLSWAANLSRPVSTARDPEVLLFGGCVASLYPQAFGTLQALAAILALAGVPYALLGENELCCGYPLITSGCEEPAALLARRNMELLVGTGAKVVVVPCPSCRVAFQEFYPALLGRAARQLTFLHAVEYFATIAHRLFPLPGRVELTITYHDPCDLGRAGGIYELPRRLLALVPGIQLVEMEPNRGNAFCCGGGGGVEMTNPGLSQAVAARRLEQAVATGAQAIVTACPQCKRSLSTAARRQRVRLPTLDLSEVLLQALQR